MLLVGTDHGLIDVDAGDTLVTGSSVTNLAHSPGGWRALLDRQVVVRLDGAGPAMVGELPEPDGQSLAVLGDGTVVVGRTNARLALVGSSVEDVAGFAAVPGRNKWENPANPTPDTRSMAARGADIWVNVHVGGLWHSGDHGDSWHGLIEPDADIHEVRADDRTVAVATAVGFASSRDGGISWSWSTEGLHGAYLRSVAMDGDTFYVGAAEDFFADQAAVYRARRGAPFVRCTKGLPEWFPSHVDTAHLDAAGGRVVIGQDRDLYLSENEGETWEASTVADPITTVRFG